MDCIVCGHNKNLHRNVNGATLDCTHEDRCGCPTFVKFKTYLEWSAMERNVPCLYGHCARSASRGLFYSDFCQDHRYNEKRLAKNLKVRGRVWYGR